jgi:hypothetical protein
MTTSRQNILRGLFLAGCVAVGVAAYAALQVLTSGSTLSGFLPLIASFGCFGLLLGAIFAFDAPSDFAGTSRPVARVITSCVAGLALSLVWHWPMEAALLAVLTAGALGYFGMSWAKYVDF